MKPANTIARHTFVVISIALLAILVVMIRRVYDLQTNLLELQRDVAKTQSSLLAQMSTVKKASAINLTSNRATAESIKDELEKARQQLQASSGEAKAAALADVRRLEKELKLAKVKQQDLEDQLNHQLSDVRQVVGKTDEKIGGMSTEVSSIKSEVAETKSDLRKAMLDYKRMTGDMGVMSGLIATNTKELDALKALGERKYTEFTIQKSKATVKVDAVSFLLKKTDPSHHRFSIEVYADDLVIQKKDKTVNEPLQFYVHEMKQPYEIVVNEVQKDAIKGYLAIPKIEAVRQ
jgi:hypothetical protein